MNNLRLRRNNILDRGFEDFYNVIDDFFNGSFTPAKAMEAGSFKVDIEDRDDSYGIIAELPGIDKDEIEITLEEGKLRIAVEKVEDEEEKEKNYLHRERRVRSMSRTMYFKDIDEENLEASLDQGVLEIKVPKKSKKDDMKKIEIQ
ncbi:MAG: Hsp20 family protein [Tissierellia bacterium]|nr:Hsp20 family protein [Tissierellia bacterium]